MSFKINDYTKSRALFERAEKVIPSGVYGHLGPAEGCFIPVEAYPLFAEKAQGSYFWDVDGNKFIDYMCGYGPDVLGYNDKDVNAAAFEQSKIADCTTSPSPKRWNLQSFWWTPLRAPTGLSLPKMAVTQQRLPS